MNIRIIKTDEEFLLLKNDWARLSRNLLTVNSFEWMFTWWKFNKENNSLNIVVVENQDNVVGIAPLFVNTQSILKCLKIKKLCFLGGEISDFLDFLVEPNHEREEVFFALLDYAFNNINFDYVSLGQINSAYPNFDLWEKYAEIMKFDFEPYRQCTRCNITEFHSYDEFFGSLSKNLRKDLRRLTNKVEREIPTLEYVFKAEITEEDIDIMAEINIKRQKFLYDKGMQDRFCYFTDDKKMSFMKEFFCNSNKDSKMLAYLTIDGKVVAYDIVLTNKEIISFWNGTFDLDYEPYSPSKLLTNELVKYAFDHNYRYFDFMRGEDNYKFQWINEFSQNYNFRKHKSYKTKLANWLKAMVPESFVQTITQRNFVSEFSSD